MIIYNRGLSSSLLLHVIKGFGVPAAADATQLTSAIICGVSAGGARTGMQALLDAKSRFNAQPRLLIAPGHTSKQPVATAADSLAGKLRAIAVIDGPNVDDEAAIAYATNFGSKRLYMIDPGAKAWDNTTNGEISLPASTYAAGLFCQTDAKIGFWASPSNKESLNDHPDIRRVFDGFYIETVPIQYTVGVEAVDRSELIIFSWDDAADPVGLF